MSESPVFSLCRVQRAAHAPAGVQHVGHEGDGVDAAGRVHDVDHHTGEGRRLKHTRAFKGTVMFNEQRQKTRRADVPEPP